MCTQCIFHTIKTFEFQSRIISSQSIVLWFYLIDVVQICQGDLGPLQHPAGWSLLFYFLRTRLKTVN